MIMEMKPKFIMLSLCIVSNICFVNAQDRSTIITAPKKHEIRLSISDNLALSIADVFGSALGQVATGSKRTDEKSSAVFGIGYRYHVSRLRIGADCGFGAVSSKIIHSGMKMPTAKEQELNFLFLPVAEFVYFRSGLFELYGSAAVGADFTRRSEKEFSTSICGADISGVTEKGGVGVTKTAVRQSDSFTSFAWQVNPVALRVGNHRIGGFLEAGLGYKGIVTAGVSFKF